MKRRLVSGALPRPVRSLYWLVRREIWENPVVYTGPALAATVYLLGFAVTALRLPQRVEGLALDPSKRFEVIVLPYSVAATVVLMTAYVVAAGYSSDALHGERRDRSILFWKSLPVSDATTVASKAVVPILVVPLAAVGISLVTQLAVLALSTTVLAVNGSDLSALWLRLPLGAMTLQLIYGALVHALWHAPLYAWLMLVSAWVRRTPILWAVLPAVAATAFERAVVGTRHLEDFFRFRLAGALEIAFDTRSNPRGWELHPLRFLVSPGLWLGLIAAAVFLAVAVKVRRTRDPI